MNESKENKEFNKIVSLDQVQDAHEDRFSFIRKHFLSSLEEDLSDLNKQLLEMQSNQPYFKTFLWKKKSLEWRWTRMLVECHWEDLKTISLEPDFTFNLNFGQKIVLSTNEDNIGMLSFGSSQSALYLVWSGCAWSAPGFHLHFLVYLLVIFFSLSKLTRSLTRP